MPSLRWGREPVTPERLRFIFLRETGGKSYPIKLWEEFEPDARVSLLTGFCLNPGEVPVIAWPGPPTSVVITTRRIFGRSAESR